MDFDKIRKAVLESVGEFKKRDKHLRDIGSSERSMINKVSSYLESRIKDFDVDTEYNRYGGIPKSLDGNRGFGTVFPDLIVHKRGAGGPNILVIEAKKIGNSGKDLEKILAYLEDDHLLYEFGLLLVFNSKNIPIQLHWLNKDRTILKEEV